MTIKDNEGHTPLDVAKNSENEDCVEVILKSKEEAKSEEASIDKKEEKASNDEDSTTQIVSVDVHETETERKEEESTGAVTEDTSQEDQTNGDAEPSLDEREPSSTPPPKKKERRVSFKLDGEETEIIDKEISNEDPTTTEGAIPEIENDDVGRKLAATDQSSEAAVSH